MWKAILWFFCAGLFSCSNTKQFAEIQALNATRAPTPDAGAPGDTLSYSGTADASIELIAWKVYSIVCTSDVRVRWGDLAAPTAVSTDMLLRSGVVFFWYTTDKYARYVGAVQDAASGTCQIVGHK